MMDTSRADAGCEHAARPDAANEREWIMSGIIVVGVDGSGTARKAAEAARDLAYATRLEAVISALAPGSPLDDLDEAVRAADASGGIRGFMTKRKLRKIVTQQTALGWRTIIGKISSVVDWRE